MKISSGVASLRSGYFCCLVARTWFLAESQIAHGRSVGDDWCLRDNSNCLDNTESMQPTITCNYIAKLRRGTFGASRCPMLSTARRLQTSRANGLPRPLAAFWLPSAIQNDCAAPRVAPRCNAHAWCEISASAALLSLYRPPVGRRIARRDLRGSQCDQVAALIGMAAQRRGSACNARARGSALSWDDR
jgi:hypothetical protein